MKNSGTLIKAVLLVLMVALIASLTGNAYLWREFTALTTVPASALASGNGTATTGSGERVSLLDRYADMREQVDRRLGKGRDVQSFITPNDPAIAAIVKEVTTDDKGDPTEYWHNCERLYRWVIMNIDYVPDSYVPVLPESMNGEIKWINDCWRTPAETLRDKAGDCEDLSALLASLLLNYNQHEFGVWMIEVQNKEGGHVAIAFPIKNGMVTIVDPSIRYNTATTEGGQILTSKEAGVAVNAWLEKLQEKVPGAQVVLIFSDTLYQEFTGTADFLNWVKANVK